MSNRPDPITFANTSYYLAIVSALIMVLAFLLGLAPSGIISSLSSLIWLVLITSAIGTFLAAAARSDFKREPGPEEAQKRARIGLRVNLAALAFMLVLMLIIILLKVLPGLGG